LGEFREKHAKAFEGFERIERIADQLLERNQAKAVLDSGRFATLAAISLYAKARKAARGLRVLAESGFGEDALILGRSMVNLAIDFEYICGRKSTAEALARQWFARGRVVRHEFATKTGTTWKGADKIDWKRENILANAWKACPIEQRARAANLPSYYDLPYRHGCSFDHSDSWGAASFLDITTEGSVDLLTAPSAAFADFALIAGAFAFAQVIKTFSDFYGFDKPGADEELEGTLKTHFPKEKHAGTSTSSGEGQSS
jgi:hypothetical protein